MDFAGERSQAKLEEILEHFLSVFENSWDKKIPKKYKILAPLRFAAVDLKRSFSEAKVELGNVVAQLPVAADETGSDFVDRDAAVKVFEQLFEELVSLWKKLLAIWKQIAIHIDATKQRQMSFSGLASTRPGLSSNLAKDLFPVSEKTKSFLTLVGKFTNNSSN